MDSGSTNVLKQLDERIDKLRSLGVERGLSVSEIDDCILKCVNGEVNVKNATKRKGSSRSRQRQLCYSAFGVCAGFWAVVAGLYVLSDMHAPTANFFSSVIQPFVYPFMRNVRLVGLPVLRRYDMTVYYDEECLIDNPYYSPNPPACETCEDVEEIKSKNYSSITVSDDPDTEPLLLTGGFDPVSLHKLMEHCRNYEQELGEGVHLFESTSSHIRALGPFLNLTEEEAQADPKFHVIWHTRMVAPARVLRTIYKRPAFIAYQHEVGLEKTVLIDSPNAESYRVPLGGNPYAWYVQSSGHRRLVLMPKPDCASKCQSFQITMKPGEMLYIFTDPWTLTSMPLIGGGDGPIKASVAFIGTFNSE